jgi:hypothetical protein
VWDQSNGKQMILVSMDTHMYKQCVSMKLKKKECSRLPASGCRTNGGNFAIINPNNKSKVTRKI